MLSSGRVAKTGDWSMTMALDLHVGEGARSNHENGHVIGGGEIGALRRRPIKDLAYISSEARNETEVKAASHRDWAS